MEPQLIGQWAMIDNRLVWVWTTVETESAPNKVEPLRSIPLLEKAAA